MVTVAAAASASGGAVRLQPTTPRMSHATRPRTAASRAALERERVGVPGCEGLQGWGQHFQAGQGRTLGWRSLSGRTIKCARPHASSDACIADARAYLALTSGSGTASSAAAAAATLSGLTASARKFSTSWTLECRSAATAS